MPSPARRGGAQPHAPATTITAAALALRISLVAVAAIIDAYKPFGLRYTDVDYDVLKDGARAMYNGGSPFQRATRARRRDQDMPYGWLTAQGLQPAFPEKRISTC